MPASLVVQGNLLHLGDKRYRCAIGKGGVTADKREGDGCTPIGTFALRECWYRADKMAAPQTQLPLRIIQPDDGWCDEPADGRYNRHFIISKDNPSSFEHLWREDDVYDLIIPLGYNDDPIIPGKGSAIFMHLAKPNYTPTEGCIALAREDLLAILPELSTEGVIEIK